MGFVLVLVLVLVARAAVPSCRCEYSPREQECHLHSSKAGRVAPGAWCQVPSVHLVVVAAAVLGAWYTWGWACRHHCMLGVCLAVLGASATTRWHFAWCFGMLRVGALRHAG